MHRPQIGYLGDLKKTRYERAHPFYGTLNSTTAAPEKACHRLLKFQRSGRNSPQINQIKSNQIYFSVAGNNNTQYKNIHLRI